MWPQMFTKTLPADLPQRHMWPCIRTTVHWGKQNTRHSEVNGYYTELVLTLQELKCHCGQTVREAGRGEGIDRVLNKAYPTVDPLGLQTHFLAISLQNWGVCTWFCNPWCKGYYVRSPFTLYPITKSNRISLHVAEIRSTIEDMKDAEVIMPIISSCHSPI